ncbi:hypothetical protein QTP88_014974 [Uroleucon formosanum]
MYFSVPSYMELNPPLIKIHSPLHSLTPRKPPYRAALYWSADSPPPSEDVRAFSSLRTGLLLTRKTRENRCALKVFGRRRAHRLTVVGDEKGRGGT